jgi:polyadenylate-binding protein
VCFDHVNHTKSLGYGYLNFATPEDSQKVLNELNYSELPPNGRVCRLMKKQPRHILQIPQGLNLCVKNLPENYNSKKLNDIFKDFGPIISAKVS